MKLSREKIQRMVQSQGSSSGSGSGSSDDYTGLLSNYVTIDFFNRIFAIHGLDENDEEVDILPNSMDNTVESVEVLGGMWTEQYVSALGQNPEGGGGSVVLNACLSSINASALGVPTGTNTALIFNGNTWVYRQMDSINMSAVWQALGASTSEQINISHLTDALVNYATASDVSTLQGYFTNGKANSALEADTLATARTIWGQSFDGSANITGNMTGVTNIDALLYFDTTNSRIGVIQQTPAYTLDVTGTMRLTGAATFGSTMTVTGLITANGGITIPSGQSLTIGDAVITWDATHDGIKITKGLYSETFISALGAGNTGSSGVDMATVWQALAASTSEQINISHLTGALSTYATQSYVSTYVSNNLALYNLSDVDVSGATNGMFLKFNGQKWDAGNDGSGSGLDADLLDGQHASYFAVGTKRYLKINGTDYEIYSPYTTTIDADSIYLKLTGGTLHSSIYGQQLTIKRDNANDAVIRYENSNGFLGYIGMGNNGAPYWTDVQSGVNTYYFYHSGNFTPSDYVTLAGAQTITGAKTFSTTIKTSMADGGIQCSSTNYTESFQFGVSSNGGYVYGSAGNIYLRFKSGCVGVKNSTPAKTLDVTGTFAVSDAATLSSTLSVGDTATVHSVVPATTRTYNLGGTSAMFATTYTRYIDTADAYYLRLKCNNTEYQVFDCDHNYAYFSNCSVGINTTTPGYKLHVNGDFKAESIAIEHSNEINSYYSNANMHLNYRATGVVSLCVGGGNAGVGTISPSYKLDVYGVSRSKYMIFYNNAYNGNSGYVGGGASGSDEIILEAYSGNALSLWSNGNRTIYLNTSNNVGIGNMTPSYKLHVTGDIYATGGVTCLSDARKKDVVCELPMKVEDVAGAPAIRFLWKDNRKEGNQAGTLAQYWQKVLPEVITDKSGELSMQYGVAALVSAIVTARKVVDHERRIKELESENAQLRKDLDGMNKRLSWHISDSMPLG